MTDDVLDPFEFGGARRDGAARIRRGLLRFDVQDAQRLKRRQRRRPVFAREQERLLSRELRVTTQRVNLFEKVKIPECRENIRRIRVQISDQETAAVARSKIAKEKSSEVLI